MATDSNPTDDLAQIQKQIELLKQQLTVLTSQQALNVAQQTQEAQQIQAAAEALKNQATAQLNLITTQVALDTAKQTQEAQLRKSVAEVLKNEVTAQIALETEQAKGPFSELAGIKAATAGMQLPTGKSGTIQLAAGAAGTSLLRSKGPMIKLLDGVATELAGKFPNGAVIVTDTQIEQAYQADFTALRISSQTQNLKKATKDVLPTQVAQPMIASVIAGAYSAGLVLDTVNSLGKLFRVDRKVDIFSADAEAVQLLGYLLESKNSKFVAAPATLKKDALDQANTLLAQLTDLHNAIQAGTDRLVELKKIEEEEAKTKPAKTQLQSASAVTELNAQLASAKSMMESLDPSTKSEAFWNQVKGQLLSATIKNRDRLLIEAKGQALQINESRWYWPDRIKIGGEVQIVYRLLDKDGAPQKSGVILRASEMQKTSFDDMPEMTFQTGN